MDEQKQLNQTEIKLKVSSEHSSEISEKAASRSLSRLPEPDKFSPNYFVGAFALTLFGALVAISVYSPSTESGVWWCSMFLVQSILIIFDIELPKKSLRTVRLAQERRYGLIFLIMMTAFMLTVLLSEMVLHVLRWDPRIFQVFAPFGIIWACLMGGWDDIRRKQIGAPEHPMIQECPKAQD